MKKADLEEWARWIYVDTEVPDLHGWRNWAFIYIKEKTSDHLEQWLGGHIWLGLVFMSLRRLEDILFLFFPRQLVSDKEGPKVQLFISRCCYLLSMTTADFESNIGSNIKV